MGAGTIIVIKRTFVIKTSSQFDTISLKVLRLLARGWVTLPCIIMVNKNY